MFTEKTENEILRMASAAANDLTFFESTPEGRAAELAEAILPALEMSYPDAIREVWALRKENGRDAVNAALEKLVAGAV